jgi:hypothetical protein
MLWAALGLVVIIGVTSIFLAEPIPPRALTRTRVFLLEKRIVLFINAQHRLPTNLAELPERAGYDNSFLDAWGVPIMYSFDSNDIVTLESVESMKHPDSNGNHEKIEGHFNSKDTNGLWRKEP